MQNAHFLPGIAFGQRVASLSASRIVRILGPVGPGLEARSYAQVARRRLRPQKTLCETLIFLHRIAFGQKVASLSASKIVRILGPVGPR